MPNKGKTTTPSSTPVQSPEDTHVANFVAHGIVPINVAGVIIHPQGNLVINELLHPLQKRLLPIGANRFPVYYALAVLP